MAKKTKRQKVLEYMKKGHTITSMDAFRLFRATRLSGDIFALKKKGNKIITHIEKGKEGTKYARYEWVGEVQNG